jgi:hypothetical protein
MLPGLKNQNGRSSFVFPNQMTGKLLTSVKSAFSAACRRAGITGLMYFSEVDTYGLSRGTYQNSSFA